MKFKELVQDHERFPFGIVGKVEVMQDKEDHHGFDYFDYDDINKAVEVHGDQELIQLFAADGRIVFVLPRIREESSHDR